MMRVLFCKSASGENIQSLMLNKGKSITAYTLINEQADQEYSVSNSERGWMVGEVYFSWIVNIFNPELERKKIKKACYLVSRWTFLPLDVKSSCLCQGTWNYNACSSSSRFSYTAAPGCFSVQASKIPVPRSSFSSQRHSCKARPSQAKFSLSADEVHCLNKYESKCCKWI